MTIIGIGPCTKHHQIAYRTLTDVCSRAVRAWVPLRDVEHLVHWEINSFHIIDVVFLSRGKKSEFYLNFHLSVGSDNYSFRRPVPLGDLDKIMEENEIQPDETNCCSTKTD